MAIIRWDPFADLRTLHGQVDEMFNQAFGGLQTAQLTPTTDIYMDDGKQMIVEVHLPHFKEDEVSVDVRQGTLEIKAEHQEKEEDKKKRQYMLRESSSSFYRHLGLPDRADADKVTAHFKDGLLKVNIPFKATPKPKRITIKAAKSKK